MVAAEVGGEGRGGGSGGGCEVKGGGRVDEGDEGWGEAGGFW